MSRKQILVSAGVVLAFTLAIVLVIFGPTVLWQMLLAMHGSR